MVWMIVLAMLAAGLAAAYAAAPLWLVSAGVLAFLAAIAYTGGWPQWLVVAVFAIAGLKILLLNIPPLRRALVMRPLLAMYRRMLPPMSETERVALEAGTVWWEGELFRGSPDWNRLLAYPQPHLTAEEQHFLDVDTEELCRMSDDWETSHVLYDLPPHVWQFIKERGFLGMIIPKDYGGKGFSAWAHSAVVHKLATRCSATTVTVMVPNSLGPAELLLHYGTPAQKLHYLPRLARGEEIPCFALTSPQAGSDAASIPDYGVVCKGQWGGREVLGMRVTWDKRYITLGPVATLLGLAFRLYDPDHLLGEIEDIGITCALVPTRHPGVHIGRRHLPLNAVFQNGPNWGREVFMPLDWIIGGPAMAGQGWRMLMECLAAGRSISLPASTTGMSKLAVRAVGGYARVRYQFKTAIGKFEGVQEALARMGGNLYLMDAVRKMTAGAVDLGEKPSVVSAIAKYHVTERARSVVNDGMDILGGKGICLGPSNFLGRAYQQVPVSITVEGANILTRSLIIFGQGAIRCHPYVLAEMHAAGSADQKAALAEFDAALAGHVGYVFRNAARAFVMGLTGSHYVGLPDNAGRGIAAETRRYYQQLTRFSAAFAFIADVAMLSMGGDLKRKEKLSARMGDVLSMMYLASCCLKRFEDDQRPEQDLPLLQWAIWDCMFAAQNALEGVISNFPIKAVGKLLKWTLFPLGRPYTVPADKLGEQVAQLLIAPGAARDRLTADMHIPRNDSEVVGAIEAALAATMEAEALEARLRAAHKEGRISGRTPAEWMVAAQATGIASADDAALLKRRDELRNRVIRVDDFAPDFQPESNIVPATTHGVALEVA
ncbi:MAG: acyl-CoA dehydrogenase [Rhodocyclaceae bacterium]|nr:acyl-CoA dehydrogenase [Rhodocyclaceae bacterium]MBX3667245.1 acyl-CoA dehydrogenase [Rhodocyclaceae bacterium]